MCPYKSGPARGCQTEFWEHSNAGTDLGAPVGARFLSGPSKRPFNKKYKTHMN
jgi:hypothetical protein